jgi:hypothetical protein
VPHEYFDHTLASNLANTTGSVRPDRIANGNLPRGERTPDRWFDRTAFAAPGPYLFGNSGRMVLSGPGSVNLDAAVARVFRLTEAVKLDFRFESFNVFNEAHFGLPNTQVDRPVGGTISATASPARQLQFAAKLVF